MSRIRKFAPGPVCTSTPDVIAAVLGGSWLYLFDRPNHPLVFAHMQIRTIDDLVERGFIRHALVTDEWLAAQDTQHANSEDKTRL